MGKHIASIISQDCKACEEVIKKVAVENAIDHIARDITHEIRNPLTSIGGWLVRFMKEFENLKKYSRNDDKISVPLREMEKLITYANIIEREIIHIEQILKIGVDFAKYQEIPFLLVDLESILKEVADSEYDQRIMFHFHLDIGKKIYANPVGIKMLILNIFKNAKEAILELGKMEQGEIRIITGIDKESNYAYFDVINNGPQISENILNRIFERNFTTKGSDGSGLGLYISKKIVKAHNGKIEAKTLPDGQTSFKVFLPIKKWIG